MSKIILSALDTHEILRYMGCPPEQADASLQAMVEQCAGTMLETACPRWAHRAFPISLEAGGVRLSTGLLLPGQDILSHLQGCTQVEVFCATLSAQVDRVIRQAESQDMLRALCLDCCATAAVEQLCDQWEVDPKKSLRRCCLFQSFFLRFYLHQLGGFDRQIQLSLLAAFWMRAVRL